MNYFLGALAAVCVCAVVAWFGSDGSVMVGSLPLFALCGVLALVVNWLVFIHAWVARTEIYFDLTGSITYVAMVLLAITLSGHTDMRSLVLTGCVLIWAGRLGPFLFQRVKTAGEDRRFRAMKESFPMFFMTWTLQGTWVFVTACCALAAITSTSVLPVGFLFWMGLVLWIFGFTIEVIADRQKTAFRAEPENQNRFIRTGLWAWSRHPNYFGEIVLWMGVALMAAPALSGGQFVTLISPLFVVFLLTFVSGVRMLEARGNKQWGDDPEYQQYKAQTPVLMLWPPAKKAS